MLWAPAFSAAKSVVPEPTNGSKTRVGPWAKALLIIDSAQAAENPALKRNHLWTGSRRLSTKVVELSGAEVGWVTKSGNKSCCSACFTAGITLGFKPDNGCVYPSQPTDGRPHRQYNSVHCQPQWPGVEEAAGAIIRRDRLHLPRSLAGAVGGFFLVSAHAHGRPVGRRRNCTTDP